MANNLTTGNYGLVRCTGGTPGSSGLLVRLMDEPAALYLLSAGHVLAMLPFDGQAKGTVIEAVKDMGGSSPSPIATLHDFTDFSTTGSAQGDAAICKLTLNDMSPKVGPIMPAGVGYFLARDMEAKIYSAARGKVVRGKVKAIKSGGTLDYLGPQGQRIPIPFGSHVECDYDSIPGDSGAPVFNIYNFVIGMHIWGGAGTGVFLPIGPLLKYFRAEPVLAAPDNQPQIAASSAGQTPADKDSLTLARTLWGEARGEQKKGMQAVACVVHNRVRKGGWWGRNIYDVCTFPNQFSCWNKNDPNYSRLQLLTENDSDFKPCLEIARETINPGISDITNGATHFHATGIMPQWALHRPPCAVIGNHIFYKDIA